MGWEERLKAQIEDEQKAWEKYTGMAEDASREGMPNLAAELGGIARDELKHKDVLTEFHLAFTKTERERAGYSWRITNPAVGEIYETGERYVWSHEAESSAKAFLKEERHPYPGPGGYKVEILGWPGGLLERTFWVKEERPFPQTYSDWVDLAEDIKAKYPGDTSADLLVKAEVNYHLGCIAEEEENPQAAQEAKRLLAGKAVELGLS